MNKIIETAKQAVNAFFDLNTKKNSDTTDTSNIDALIHQISLQHQAAQKIFFDLKPPNIQSEIYYFKKIKSVLLGYIQFLTFVKDIELRKPPIKSKKLKDYYLVELSDLKSKIITYNYWHSYYKSNSAMFDKQFFTRMESHMIKSIGDTVVEINKDTNTPYVPIFSMVIGFDLLNEYLKNKIKSFDCSNTIDINTESPLKWTDSKINLIELIYALHAKGSFNYGQIDLKSIAQYFENIFQIDLGQVNRIFVDIRSRKNGTTKYLDILKECLINKINNTDNESNMKK